MTLRASDYPRASAALAGLSLTTQIAVAATDGIPIVKQVLAVVSRIVTLAEDIDQRREALHALADSARTLGLRIEAVVSDREPEGEMLQSVEAVHTVLRSIEAFFNKHRSKTRVQRALSYAFTTSKHITGLSQALSGAVQNFLLVAALDTNTRVRENSRCIGKFRLLHDYEVEKLEHISEFTSEPGARYSFKYYAARVEGRRKVFVVRYLQRNANASDEETDRALYFERRLILEHDCILKHFSTVKMSHPNIARFYGMSVGDHLHRFTVMNSGRRPFSKHFETRQLSVGKAWEIIAKLLDAANHLMEYGAAWDPCTPDDILFDATGSPIIGCNHDLYLFSHDLDTLEILVLSELLHRSFRIADTGSLAQSMSDVLADFRMDAGFNAEVTWTERMSLPRELLVLPSLDRKILAYLHGALDRDQCNIYYQYGLGSLLLHAAVGAPGGIMGTTFNAEHEPEWEETVFIKLARLEETTEGMNYLCDSIMLPASQAVEAWQEVEHIVPIVIPEEYKRVYVSLLYPADEGSLVYIGGYR